MDAAHVHRTAQNRAGAVWERGDDNVSRVRWEPIQLQRQSIVRVLLCPPRGAPALPDPRAELRLYLVGGAQPLRMRFLRDEGRGERCWESNVRTEVAGSYLPVAVASSAAALAPIATLELFASTRVTKRHALPALLLLLGLVLVLASRPRASSEPPEEELAPHERTPPVDEPGATAAAVGSYVGLQVLLGFAGYGIGRLPGMQGWVNTAVGNLLFQLLQHACLIGISLWFLGAMGRFRSRLALPRPTARDVLLAAPVTAVLLLIAGLTTTLMKDVGSTPMGAALEHLPLRLSIGFTALVAPLSEELFFRGVLVRSAGRRSVALGAAISTLVFVLAHALQLWGQLRGLVPIACVAVVNSVLRVRTGSLARPWVVHTMYNSMLTVGLYLGR